MTTNATKSKKVRAIAFYLPQYHPIPENDKFWGKGFTEWSNVAKAKPLFRGHSQPLLPSDLGFYDLRVPEIRRQQADLARSAGIEGFCYWHYWFGNRVRALERIFDEVLSSNDPDYPFCLGWANESWTGKWHGLNNQTLFEQTYPGTSDYVEHFYALLPAFKDHRYIRVNGRPLFLVYKPNLLPSALTFIACWNKLAGKEGLKPFFFVSNQGSMQDSSNQPFDAFVRKEPVSYILDHNTGMTSSLARHLYKRLKQKVSANNWNSPSRAPYKSYVNVISQRPLLPSEFPCLVPCWDNTPRCGVNGCLFEDPDPDLFYELSFSLLSKTILKEPDHRIVFIKSWNEWAEGNVMEPSVQYGNGYLEAFRYAISAIEKS